MINNIIKTTDTDTSTIIANVNLATSKINAAKITTNAFNETNSKSFNKISQIPFGVEEYKIIIFFKNNGCIGQLMFNQLVILSKLYSFSEADLIALQDNLEFIKYLNDSYIIKYNGLPDIILKKNIIITKMAFFSGDYMRIRNIPPGHQTVDVYKKFVECCVENEQCYTQISYLAENLQTQEIWHKAYIRYSYYVPKVLFALMPDKLKTQDFCLKVCEKVIDSFQFLPEKFKTFNLCKSYLLNATNIDINTIPKQFKDELQYIFITRIKKFKTDCMTYKRPNEITGLESLSIDILKSNPDIIIESCISSAEVMDKIDSSCINSDILQAVAKATIINISKKYMCIDLVLIRIKNCSFLDKKEINIINDYFVDYKDKIQQLALERVEFDNKMEFLRYIPDYLTEEKCYQYINKSPSDYKKLPDKYKFNINIILYILKINPSYLCTLKNKLLTAEEYQKIFDNHPEAPSWQFGIGYHDNHIRDKANLFDTVPNSHRSLAIWLYLCNNKHREYISKIPEQLFTKEALCYLVDEYVKWNNITDINFIERIFYFKLFDNALEDKILFHLLQCIARSSDVLFSVIKAVRIPQAFKEKLIENLKAGNLGFTPSTATELYSKTNPIQQAVATKFVTDLLTSCYKHNQENRLILPKITQHFKKYITPKKISQLPLDDLLSNIFKNAKITGGRTIQVDISADKAMFYKFRKPEEDLTSFIKEGYFFEFLNYDSCGKSLKQKLKSDIPELQKIVRIPTNKLSKSFFSCEDGIDKFIDSNGIECADVLVFVAPIDYLKYAHEVDSKNSENPYKKAETGILNACHDIGVFTSIGVYHTTTLPAYHFAVNERKWGAVHMLLRRLTVGFCRGELAYPAGSDINMVGKLEKWDTDATNRPDYGYTGLRDFGDCEFFGEISSALKHQDSKDVKNFSVVIQNILAANTICECLLASVLLYARLHKSSTEYHYKNNYYKQNLAKFIEKMFSNFLIGRLQTTNIKLANFMRLSSDDYNKWLDRAVTEILYWTAARHSLTENIDSNNVDFNDHVSEHIKNRKLPEYLYEHYHMLDDDRFEIRYNEHNLGLDNATFPLLALMNFMYLFNTRLNEHVT